MRYIRMKVAVEKGSGNRNMNYESKDLFHDVDSNLMERTFSVIRSTSCSV